MCLNTLLDQKEINRHIGRNQDSKGYLTVYKIVKTGGSIVRKKNELFYYALFQRVQYETGTNHANTEDLLWCGCNYDRYESGFHFYTNMKEAKMRFHYIKTEYYDIALIKCRVHKSWITGIGKDQGMDLRTVITNKAIFPSPKNKKAIIKAVGFILES